MYRATRDGFLASAFHAKCDGMANTVSIIKTNGNYVFGGYSAAQWVSNSSYGYDASAFLFSLRKNGVSNNLKFTVTMPQVAIYGFPTYGPTFGSTSDIRIIDKSNVNVGSATLFCYGYQCPQGYAPGATTKAFLAGSYNNWLTTEIEIYQMQ